MAVVALVPDHGDVEAVDRQRRRQHLQAGGLALDQALGHQGDQVGAADDVGHEQEGRRRQHDLARQPEARERLVHRRAEGAAGRRDDHLFQFGEGLGREPAADGGMAAPRDEHVSLMEERAQPQAVRGLDRLHQAQVDVAARHLGGVLVRVQVPDGDAHARCFPSQPQHQRTQDRGLQVIRGGDGHRQFGAARLEVQVRARDPAHLVQRLAQRLEQRQGLGGGRHAALRREQQRVLEDIAQPAELRADRGLAEAQPGGGLGDIALGQQRLERHEQVEVEPAGIHALDSRTEKT